MLSYPFNFPKFTGTFLKRLNRFVIEVELGGRIEQAYLANPGRLWELLLPGTEILLSPAPANRKLPYTVMACRKRKNKHWHIDYLIAEAAKVTPVPIVTGDSLECELSAKLAETADSRLNDFGSSDCRCAGHLYYFTENPFQNRRFIDIIQYYRIARLEDKLQG